MITHEIHQKTAKLSHNKNAITVKQNAFFLFKRTTVNNFVSNSNIQTNKTKITHPKLSFLEYELQSFK